MNLEEIKAKVETATPTEFVILCRKYFMPLIAEAIQVAAMAQKFIDSGCAKTGDPHA